MIYSSHRFTLDIQKLHSQVAVPVSLGDTAKTFYITLKDGGQPYYIDAGCLAMLSIKRPSGTFLQAFCTIEDNTRIKYDFSENVYTAVEEGVHDCELTLTSPDGLQLSTSWFNMVVYQRVVNFDDINIPDEDRDAIDAMLAREAERQAAESARGIAEKARDDAEKVRMANELVREAAENERKSAETVRLADETERDNAEQERKAAEEARKSLADTMIDITNDAGKIVAEGLGMGVVIWQTGSDLSEADNVPLHRHLTSILTPIDGKMPKANDYIIDSVGNLLHITYVNAADEYMTVFKTSIAPVEADGTAIWHTTTPIKDLTVVESLGSYLPIGDITAIYDKVIKAGDFVGDTYGWYGYVDGVYGDTAAPMGVYLVNITPPSATTIWHTATPLTCLTKDEDGYILITEIDAIEGKVIKAGDYIFDADGCYAIVQNTVGDPIAPIQIYLSDIYNIGDCLLKSGAGRDSIRTEKSQAITDDSISLGDGNSSGMRGYYISAIDFTSKKIYLTEGGAQVMPVSGAGEQISNFETPAYEEGDEFTIINHAHFPLCGKIAAVENNVITYSGELPFTEILVDPDYETRGLLIDDYTFYVHAKPEIGDVIFSYGSTVLGGKGNRVTGTCGTAGGYYSQVVDDVGTAFGYKCIAAYMAFAAGSEAKALKEQCIALGIGAVARAVGAIALGIYGTASGHGAAMLGGQGHDVSGNYAVAAGGIGNVASAIYAAVLGGAGCQAKGDYAAVIASLNSQATALFALVHGDNCYAQYPYAVTIGDHLVAGGPYTHNIGRYNVPYDAREAYLCVGVGTSVSDRKNGFLVYRDGQIYALGDITGGGDVNVSGNIIARGGTINMGQNTQYQDGESLKDFAAIFGATRGAASKQYSLIRGLNCWAESDFATSWGEGIVADSPHSFNVGKFNAPGYGDNVSIFSIGIGTDGNHRKNGLSLDPKGNFKVAGTITDGNGNVLDSHYGATIWKYTAQPSSHDEGNPICLFSDITDFNVDKAKPGDIIIDAEGTILVISSIYPESGNCYCEKIGCGAAEVDALKARIAVLEAKLEA